MPYSSHCRVIGPAPCYGLRASESSSRTRGAPGNPLARTFRHAHSVCATPPSRAERAPASRRTAYSVPSATGGAWPAAFAILFVANLIAPARSAVPWGSARHKSPPAPAGPRDSAYQISAGGHAGHLPMPGKAVDVVAVRPVETSLIKSNYTLSEFLYAIATSSEPFRNAGDSLLEMYTLVTGEEVRADTRKSVGQWTSALDFATGLVPDVGIARIPGDAAGIAADQMEGRPVAAERLIDMVQAADSHNFGSRGAVRKPPDIAAMREEKQRQVSQRKAQSKASRSSGGAQPDTGAHVDAHRERNVAANEDNAALAAEHTVDARPLDMPYMAHGWPHDWPHEWHIAGENEHLQGYAQSLPPDKLPIDPQRRIVTIDGRFYLRGEAGYYRATRGHSLDHWLISAPKGSGRAATVPVHVDAASGRWQAEAPLRLCGGGCGPSRESTPDSIALDQDKVRDAVAHLRNADIREAIIYAFDDLAALHLSRSNRPDLQATRDNSIIDHRMALRTSMKRIKRSLPLLKQQQEAALITTLYHYWNPYAEAFCQENAEILFHHLLVNQVPLENLRMITIKPKNRPPHVMVLYTESARLITLLEEATPHPPLNVGPDGLVDILFAREAYEARDSTVLLDPWSRSRATSFADAAHAVAMVDALDDAFAEIGHRPGSMYWVSITRPLEQSRGSVSSLGSAGSSGSFGGSGSSASGSSASVLAGATGVAV